MAVGLLLALLLAGFGSFYASRHPDGLNFVAAKAGFIDREKASPTAGGPFGGYETKGVTDQRLSRGLAGVAGCLLVLTIGGSLFWVLRRTGGRPEEGREDRDAGSATGPDPDDDAEPLRPADPARGRG
ncbi:MAG: hypothetical protein JWR42_1427 [Marmoricola sp.]|nr:hypothetical protein [Marmoricola sp.]